jgi:biotin carboxyl carrier protein
MTQEVHDEELKKKNASQSLLPSLTRQGLTLAVVQAQAQLQSGDPAAVAAPAPEKPKQAEQAPAATTDEIKVSRPTVGKLKR